MDTSAAQQANGALAARRDTLCQIISRLIDRGWTGDRILNNVVIKLFPTAVGPKQAEIWIVYEREGERHWLTADYQSEGRNALSACWGFVASMAREDEVAKAVDDYLASVEQAIGETYAARLLRRRQASIAG